MNPLTTINTLGYLVVQNSTDIQLFSYSTTERLSLQNVKRGTMVYDDTTMSVYVYNGSNWETPGTIITDDDDSSKVLRFDLSNLTHATTRSIIMPDADVDLTVLPNLMALTAAEISQLQNIGASVIDASSWGFLALLDQSVSSTSSPTFLSPLLKQSLLFEDPGVGTKTVTLAAPLALAADYSLTLPTTLPAGPLSAFLQVSPAGVISHTTSPTFESPTFKTSVLIEDPGAGTNTVTLGAPSALAGSYIMTLPTALPGSTSLALVSNTGDVSFTTTPSLSGATINGPVNGVRTYSATFIIAGDSVGPVYPIVQLVFPTSAMYTARIRLITSDWADDSKVGVVTADVCGGKDSAGIALNICAANVTAFGHANAQFSTVVAATTTTVSLTKTEDMSAGAGNYGCKLYVEVMGSSLTRVVNGNTAAEIVAFTY